MLPTVIVDHWINPIMLGYRSALIHCLSNRPSFAFFNDFTVLCLTLHVDGPTNSPNH